MNLQSDDLTQVGYTATLVHNTTSVSEMVTKLTTLPTNPPSLYLYLGGLQPLRHRSISIIIILAQSSSFRHIYFVDIHTLGIYAFISQGRSRVTLQTILESPLVPKVFFDVRNGSRALYAQFQVALRCVQDVQLMEKASRPGSRQLRNGLSECIRDVMPRVRDRIRWLMLNAAGEYLLTPEKGGTSTAFNQRPLPARLAYYCIGNVELLPSMRQTYFGRLVGVWALIVGDETKERVEESQRVSRLLLLR